MTVYKWYTGTSGQAISDRIRRLMSPGAPKSESDIADAIDRWVDSGRVLENMKSEYKLADPFKITALEQLMNIGHAKLHFEALRAQHKSYDVLLGKCREYAMKRRLEHTHRTKSDDMDIGQVDDLRENSEWELGGSHIGPDHGDSWGCWDMDVIGKGKSKGKGKYGGWAPQGKGIGFGNPGIGFNGTKGFQKGDMNSRAKARGDPREMPRVTARAKG